MKIYKSILSLQKDLNAFIRNGKTVGFVPTMGALHDGHLSLVRRAQKENDLCVVSIFVNPIQFDRPDDLKKYPQDLNKDKKMLKVLGVDVLFLPTPDMMYPPGFNAYVEVEGLTDGLCGARRPGHFRGVTTVVAKLLNIVQPDKLYLGQKDYQQAIVLKQMIKDLNMSVKPVICSIVRESDGLAMSSRNTRLTASQRKNAVVLYQALKEAKKAVQHGEESAAKVISLTKKLISSMSGAKIDYIEIVDADTLKPMKKLDRSVVIAVAAWFGSVRLIDNILV